MYKHKLLLKNKSETFLIEDRVQVETGPEKLVIVKQRRNLHI